MKSGKKDGRTMGRSSSRKPSGRQQEASSGAGGQYGEGNYAATRQYNEGMKDHVEHHDIEREARDAAPKSAAEQNEMLEAERKGRSKSRGESIESPGADVDPEKPDK